VGLPNGVRGLAGDFATGVPNSKNGEKPGLFSQPGYWGLASIAKHWGISL
jgi:hypothetical protein